MLPRKNSATDPFRPEIRKRAYRYDDAPVFRWSLAAMRLSAFTLASRCYGGDMKRILIGPVTLAILLLTACGPADNEPGPGGVTVGEARALDEAAEMIEAKRLPQVSDPQADPDQANPDQADAQPDEGELDSPATDDASETDSSPEE
jgi:hypothetical protein